MRQNPASDAALLLTRHYGLSSCAVASDDRGSGEWSTLLRIVLEQGRSSKMRDWTWIADSSLRTAHDAAALSASEIMRVLEAADQPSNKSRVLCELAKWWIRHIGEADALVVFRGRSLEHWQNELRAIRGVSWDLADRILLMVGGCAVYPLDRGSMRIVLRHGWLDTTAEYDDWQAFFVSSAGDSGTSLEQLWRWNLKVGREFCGRKPDCGNCPLKTLLPDRGAVPLEGE